MDETHLHAYQRAAVNHIVNTSHCGLMLDMGLGKTVSTLTAINELIYDHLEISSVLIIAPKRVAESVWDAECAKWDHLETLRVSKIMGNEMQRKQALRTKAEIHIISRDNVAWLCGQYGGSMLPWDMLIIDESSSFKNHKSIRFKSLRAVQPSFDRVVLLTGTPAPNGLIDLWAQIYLLDRGERLGKTISAYRDRFFKPGQRKGHIVYNYKVLAGGEVEIHRRLKDVCLSMKALDYLDMPKRVDNIISLEMPPGLAQKYKEFEREQVLELLESDITAVNAAALSNKLLQFANGAVYDEDRNVHEIHQIKLDAIEEIVEAANGKPVLIAYTFKHDLERLLKRLKKYKPVRLQTNQHIKDWNAGKIQVMLMHPASGGHGLNIQFGGNIIVWFGMTWSLELYLQFNARVWRQGQRWDQVIIHHAAIKGTLDMDVLRSLENKNTKQEGLMAAIKAKIKQYANHRQ